MDGRFRIWLPPVILCFASVLFLTWAFPRLSPATRLGLRFDRAGYIAQAQRVARAQGFDLTGWRGNVKTETLVKNQDLHARMPGDAIARVFPDAQVLTTFRANGGGSAVKMTLRTDGRLLSSKLTGAPRVATSGAHNDIAMAHRTMEQMTGEEAGNYTITSDGAPGSGGMRFRWNRAAPNQDMPRTGIEVSVRNGAVGQVDTRFNLPEQFDKRFDAFPVERVSVNAVWFLALLLAAAFALIRDGGANAARAMKDRWCILIGILATLASMINGVAQWDAYVFSFTNSTAVRILMLVLGALFTGIFFYVASAFAILNARLEPGRVRGFRLLGTRAWCSRLAGAEVLGGWLVAPLIVSLPLLASAMLRMPVFKGYDDDVLLSRFPLVAGLLDGNIDALMTIAAWGVMIPLAIRFFGTGWKRNTLAALLALLTFAVADAPFHGSQAANLVVAALDAATMLWLCSQFGLLGAVSGRLMAQILVSAGSFLVQPAHSLQASGWSILLAFGAIGLACVAALVKGPEVVAELYGESGARIQARSRREELLAEFNVARSAQQRMLPAEPPVLEGYTVAASCEPAREVGGDLYDFLRVGDGRWGIAVADVSGKGVPAALYMTLTKGLLCAAAQDSGDPRWILGAVNRHLKAVTKRKMFVTMAFAVLDPAAKRMDYVRAGHNPAVWRRLNAGETRLLGGAGIGLGIAAPALFGKTLAIETLELAPGDALVFYSDGLTEAMNAELEQFGEDRLIEAVERADGMHATAARDSILGEVRRFLGGIHAQDDLTIAVLRVSG
jgi:serine phosphatase RsbU (regulator of sigma subunit)